MKYIKITIRAAAILVATILLASCAGTRGKAPGRIMGKVIGDNSVSLPGAEIKILDSSIKTMSNNDGTYTILDVPPGEYVLEAWVTGYAPIRIKDVKVSSKKNFLLDIHLSSQTVDMGTVTVSASSPIVEKEITSNEKTMVQSEDRIIPSSKPDGDLQQFAHEDRARVLKGRKGEESYGVGGYDVSGAVLGLGYQSQIHYPPGGTIFNTEGYDNIVENEFKDALTNPLSTFSIDVDKASYSNTRRFLNNGSLPPVDAVRIEEFINYFDYEYPQPRGEDPFSITTEISECPWQKDHRLLHIGLQGKKVPMDNIPAGNLVFLLDVSGSMNTPVKLPLLKSAFKLLVNQLRSKDRVAIVVYAGASGLVLDSTPGSDKQTILDAINSLYPGGSTAGAAGIKLAYEIAKKNYIDEGNNRVILATDGDFNVGVSSDGELVKLIEEKRDQGVFLTVLGFGTGNYKDSKMEKLADKGNGNYAYIDNIMEARKVLVSELGGTLFTIAKDVKIQLEFNPARVSAYRLVGYENRILAKEDFNDDKKDAGEIGSGHTVTALYEIVPVGTDIKIGDVDDLKYQRNEVTSLASESDELLTVKFRYKKPDGDKSKLITVPIDDRSIELAETSNNYRFSAAVAEFGMLLRNSKFKGDSDYDKIIEMANGAKGRDKEEYRAEFVKLVKLARDLSTSIAESQ